MPEAPTCHMEDLVWRLGRLPRARDSYRGVSSKSSLERKPSCLLSARSRPTSTAVWPAYCYSPRLSSLFHGCWIEGDLFPSIVQSTLLFPFVSTGTYSVSRRPPTPQ